MTKIVSWNLARRDEAWRALLKADADVALVQEASAPPDDVAERIGIDQAPWHTAGAGVNRPWRTAVVKLSTRVEVDWIEARSLEDAVPGQLGVSRLGTLAAAIVTPERDEPFIVVSMYAIWEKPHESTGSSWIYADSSVHRIISDMAVLIGQQAGHRILTAGDLNILHRYGEEGSPYWASRYQTVFGRMESLGMPFVGPQAPGGRRAEPWPDELPRTSKNVPTFHTSHQNPATATRQLDFVFASHSMVQITRVRALNESGDWGPSDHCRIDIEVD